MFTFYFPSINHLFTNLFIFQFSSIRESRKYLIVWGRVFCLIRCCPVLPTFLPLTKSHFPLPLKDVSLLFMWCIFIRLFPHRPLSQLHSSFEWMVGNLACCFNYFSSRIRNDTCGSNGSSTPFSVFEESAYCFPWLLHSCALPLQLWHSCSPPHPRQHGTGLCVLGGRHSGWGQM